MSSTSQKRTATLIIFRNTAGILEIIYTDRRPRESSCDYKRDINSSHMHTVHCTLCTSLQTVSSYVAAHRGEQWQYPEYKNKENTLCLVPLSAIS